MRRDKDRLIEDLREHFSQQLHHLVMDTIDTCRRGRLDLDDIVTLITVPLLGETVLACNASGMDKRQYLGLCAVIHNQLCEAVKDLENAKIERQSS